MDGALGSEERRTQLAEWGQVRTQNHFAQAGTQRGRPRGTLLTFLVDRDTFAQPARHFVPRLGERHDMAELVPKDRFPVGGMVTLRRGTVGSDDAAEADAE